MVIVTGLAKVRELSSCSDVLMSSITGPALVRGAARASSAPGDGDGSRRLFGGDVFANLTIVDLFLFDGFKQGFEIPLSEPVIALALNEFEKDRADHGF